MKPRTIVRSALLLILAACLVGTVYVLRPGWFDWRGEHVEPRRNLARSVTRGPAYGQAVAMHGDFAAIGVPYFCGHVIDGGAVDFRRREGDQWNTYATLRASDERPGLSFGMGLDLSDRFLAVAAWGFSDDDSESIYIFRREGEPKSPTWVEEAILRPSVRAWNFGDDVTLAIDGDTLVVGAPYDYAYGVGVPEEYETGSVFVFERDETGSWTESSILKPEFLELDDEFGRSVALEDGTLVVGAPGRQEVLVYSRTDAGWQLQSTLTSTVQEPDYRFGSSVSISGDRIAVGASSHFYTPFPGGDVRVFHRDSVESDWALEYVLTSQEPYFGADVAIAAGSLATSGRSLDPVYPDMKFEPSNQLGLVALFSIEQEGNRIGTFESVLAPRGDYRGFGSALSLSETWLLIGFPKMKVGKYPGIGAVQFVRTTGPEEYWIIEYVGPIEDGIYTNRGFEHDYIDFDTLRDLMKEQQERERQERRDARDNS